MPDRSRTALARPRRLPGTDPTLAPQATAAFLLGLLAAALFVPAFVRARRRFDLPATPTVAVVTESGTVEAPSVSVGLIAAALLGPLFGWAAVAVHLATAVVAVAAEGVATPSLPPDVAAAKRATAARLRAFRGTAAAVGWGLAPQLVAPVLALVVYLSDLVGYLGLVQALGLTG